MNAILQKIKLFISGLFYGLKAADAELATMQPETAPDTSIQKEVADKRVGRHLINGEVTQAVEELRYRTYRVERESENYDYTGGDRAEKRKDTVDLKSRHVVRFSQPCQAFTQSVKDSIGDVNNEAPVKYTVDFEYVGITPRFRLENFVTLIDVDVTLGERGIKETTLHFLSEPNQDDVRSKPFIKELVSLAEGTDDERRYRISHSEWEPIGSMSFVTMKASNGEPDYISYSFGGGAITKVEKKDRTILMTIRWTKIAITDLTEKFYSPSMAKKYEEKMSKLDASSWDMEKTARCADCGKEISNNEAGITAYELGRPLCVDCYAKVYDSPEGEK